MQTPDVHWSLHSHKAHSEQCLGRPSTDLIRTVDPAWVPHPELLAAEGDCARIEVFIFV